MSLYVTDIEDLRLIKPLPPMTHVADLEFYHLDIPKPSRIPFAQLLDRFFPFAAASTTVRCLCLERAGMGPLDNPGDRVIRWTPEKGFRNMVRYDEW